MFRLYPLRRPSLCSNRIWEIPRGPAASSLRFMSAWRSLDASNQGRCELQQQRKGNEMFPDGQTTATVEGVRSITERI